MANPEAGGGEELQNALQQDDEGDSEEDQANMIAAMAGMQMDGEGQGPMTEQEISDMRMAAQLQDRYVQRAQRE